MKNSTVLNHEVITAIMSVIGARGGKRNTRKQQQARRKNVLKAHIARRKVAA